MILYSAQKILKILLVPVLLGWMLNKNSLLTGILAGLIFPALAVASSWLFKGNLYLINKPALPYFIAAALNFVLLRITFKKGLDETAKGIMAATFGSMLLLFVFRLYYIR